MMKHSVDNGVVCFIALILTNIPAQAQENTHPGWSGFYIGAQVGEGLGNDSYTQSVSATGNDTGFNPEAHMNGVAFGGYAGYNYMLDPVLLGVEGDFSDDNDIRGGFDLPDGVADSAKLRWLGSLRGRLGVADGDFLPYLTGGIAWTERNNIYSEAGVDQSLSDNKVGWTAGAGVEYKPEWLGNWSCRLEYRYTGFVAYTDTPTPLMGEPPESYSNKIYMNTLMLGVSYHLPPL